MGFYERVRKEVEERGSFTVPSSLGAPCPHCPKYREWMKEHEDVVKVGQLKTECMQTCEDVRYYDRYGINRMLQPMTTECEHLVVWVNELLTKKSAGTQLSSDELDQLRVWGDRLSLVLAMEEAKIAAAISAIEGAREATKGL